MNFTKLSDKMLFDMYLQAKEEMRLELNRERSQYLN